LQDALCVLDHWQTLAAGLLALVAGGITVYGTLAAAKRQVKAANEAADRQVAAAQEQIQAAQRQTEVMRQIDRSRIAEEEFAFHAILVAAMEAVIEDVEAARHLPFPTPEDRERNRYSPEAYTIRQRIKRAGFAELRTGFLRFGGTLTTPLFLQLDKKIEDFAVRWREGVPLLGTTPIPIPQPPEGANAELEEQLDRIEQQAIALRDEATLGMEVWRKELEGLFLLQPPTHPYRPRRDESD
jgi:hypothetical protein